MTTPRYESYEDFVHDLDQSGHLSDDPFGIDLDIGALDDADLELLIPTAKKKKAT
ncbi:hypothetical protein CcrC1_gp074 [Caulobacter phage C1]|nr:hypothetical protein CcrC1_gp074 [Caulobacter phage C1]UTU08301.1 hypothetical protein CcrC2_gp073 [Caulobacter phage C2]UTU08824.1 hypothetical protein CcrJ4_gp073 [Caulobacter phage J4]UTU09376.1 hypothetical protein CcrBL47_gp090 [Caulobacter phage BL47]UTU09936.1 hypothetical protein CcrRB23_gp074 [Caulobacter phage RB23]WGN96961.1 hypothetical protein [Bertelyvirus sp.]